MSRRAPILLWAVAMVALLPGAAQAACDIVLRDVNNVHFAGAREYSVFDPAETGQIVQFSVRHKNNEPPCPYFVTFSRGDAPNYDRYMTHDDMRLRYQIYDSPSKTHVLKDLPGANNGEVLAGVFTTTGIETHDLTYFVAIPALQVVKPGHYRDDIVITLYEGTLADAQRRDSAAVRITADAAREVEICLGCVAHFDADALGLEMNFGVLETGETRATTLRARTNDGYTLFFASHNRGVLRHLVDDDFVPYTLTIDGVAVDLSKKKPEVAHVRGLTSVDGIPFAIQVTIGNVAEYATAGEYRDDVTITVTAF